MNNFFPSCACLTVAFYQIDRQPGMHCESLKFGGKAAEGKAAEGRAEEHMILVHIIRKLLPLSHTTNHLIKWFSQTALLRILSLMHVQEQCIILNFG
jgi:hypothetical protein